MELLNLINENIKYVYITLGVIIFILIIKLLMDLAKIGKSMTPINEATKNINKNVEELNKKEAIIEHTMKTSVPFFICVFLGLKFIFAIFKDYFDTKPSKRKISKSVKRVSKYEANGLKALSSIPKIIK